MTVPTLPLGDVFDVQLGKMLDAKGNRGEPYPYLANRNVQWDRCNLAELPTMPFTEKDRQRFDLRPGDLLVCEGGEVGRTAVWRGEISECFFQKAVHRLRPRRHADPRFGLYYMRWATSTGVFRQLTTATSIAHLTKEKLETAPFPDIPVAAQRRIAAILDEADALRRKRREALGLLDDLLRATFVDMFGDPVTNPRGWVSAATSTLITDSQYGTAEKANTEGVGLPVLRMNNLTYEGRWLLDDIKHVEIPGADIDKLTVRPGDLLFNRTNSPELVGKTGVWRSRDQFAFAGYLIRFRFDETRVLPDYVSGYLNSSAGKQYLFDRAKASNNMSNFSASMFAEIPLRLPPMDTQRRFAELTWVVEAERATHEAALKSSETLFTSLLHRAFTGEL